MALGHLFKKDVSSMLIDRLAFISKALLFAFLLSSPTNLQASLIVPENFEIGNRIELAKSSREDYSRIRKHALDLLQKDSSGFEGWLSLCYANVGLRDAAGALAALDSAYTRTPAAGRLKLIEQRGAILMLTGDRAGATDTWHKLLLKNPASVAALYGLGLTAEDDGRLDEADKLYQKALRSDQRHAKSLDGRIRISHRTGTWDSLVVFARLLQRKAPDDARGYYLEGLALIRSSRPDYPAAIISLAKAEQLAPQDRETAYELAMVHLLAGNPAEALKRAEALTAKDSSFLEIRKLAAVAALRESDYKKSAIHLEYLCNRRPTAELYSLLGKTYLYMGDKNRAMVAENQALSLDTLTPAERIAGKALSEYIAGEFKQSEDNLRKALRKEPSDYKARMLLVTGLLRRGHYKEAVDFAEQGLPLSKDHDYILLRNCQAHGLLGLEKPEEAEKALQSALQADSAHQLTRMNLAAVYFSSRRFDKAAYQLQMILKNDSTFFQAKILLSRVYQAQHNYREAADILRNLIKIANDNYILLNELALLYLRSGDLTGAADASQKVKELHPDPGYGHLLFAEIYFARKDTNAAFHEIDTSVKIGGASAKGALLRGFDHAVRWGNTYRPLAYMEKYRQAYGLKAIGEKDKFLDALVIAKQFEKALLFLEKEYSDDKFRQCLMRGRILAAQGSIAKAEKEFEKAHKLQPENAAACFELGKTKLTTAKNEEAMRLFKRALVLDPSKIEYYIAVASLARARRAHGEAAEVYESGLASMPDTANRVPILNNLAMVYLDMDKSDKARQAIESALSRSQDPNLYDTYGTVLVKTGNLDGAIEAYKQAVAGAPGDGSFRYNLAQAYTRAGKHSEARIEYEFAIQASPSAPWVQQAKAAIKQ
jgi:tetratricopeptide (TPR) repeat protein